MLGVFAAKYHTIAPMLVSYPLHAILLPDLFVRCTLLACCCMLVVPSTIVVPSMLVALSMLVVAC